MLGYITETCYACVRWECIRQIDIAAKVYALRILTFLDPHGVYFFDK